MDEQSKESLDAEIKSANEVIQKLKKFAEELEKRDNNILTHLCDGLQKFLGFNPESKGYDGQGIVYSDLDRLCDGVMGFLKGVLDAVKDDDAVKTYDNMMTNKLSEVIKELNSKIGSGRKGLVASVGAVREWLEKYNSQVETLTSAVTTKLGTLSSNLSSGTGKYYTEVTDQASSPLATQLSTWTATVKKIETEVETINSNVKVLDSKLRERVMHEMKVVDKAVKMLAGSAEVQGLREQVSKVDRELDEKKAEVKGAIETKISELQDKLSENFISVNKKVEAINALHIGPFHTLMRSITDLANDLNRAESLANTLYIEYRKDILEKVHSINEEANALATVEVQRGIQEIFNQISRQLRTLEANLAALTRSGYDVKTTLEHTVQYFMKPGDSAINVNDQIIRLKDGITTAIEAYVRGELPAQIQGALTHLTKDIHNSNTKSGLLDQFVEEVTKYADKFSTETEFEKKILPLWINAILKGGAVNHRITAYVDTPGIKGQGKLQNKDTQDLLNGTDQTLHMAITDEIKKKLKEDVYGSARVAYPGKATGTISENLEKVQSVCLKFAKNLEAKIMNDRTYKFAEEIAGNVETAGLESRKSGNHHLKSALYHILSLLIHKSKSAAAQLDWLAKAENVGNIHSAMKLIKGLGDKLASEIRRTGTDQLGTQIQTTLGKSASEIDSQLGELLHEACQQAIQKLYVKVKNILDGELRSVHPTIESAIKRLSGDSMGDIHGFVYNLQTKIDELRNHVKGVNDKCRVNIQNQVKGIKEQAAGLSSSVEVINTQIQRLNTSLQQAIQEAKVTVDEASRVLSADIERVRAALTSTTEQAFEAVTREIKSMFVKQHEADLTAFKKLFDEEKEAIQGIINKDKESGLKGLINKMHINVSELENNDTLKKISIGLNLLGTRLMQYVLRQTVGENVGQLEKLMKAFNMPLTKLYLTEQPHYDHNFCSLVETLNRKLAEFSLTTFSDCSGALIDPLKAALKGLTKELGNSYVSAYSGSTIEWQHSVGTDGGHELTNEAKKCAKVGLTIMHTLFNDLTKLRAKCAGGKKHGWKRYRLNSTNELGIFLNSCGYELPKTDTSNDAELKNKSDFKGSEILNKLIKGRNNTDTVFDLADYNNGILADIYEHITQYYTICHLIVRDSTTYPSTVRDMLSWFSGLKYTSVFSKVQDYCVKMLTDDRNKRDVVIEHALTLLDAHIDDNSVMSYRLLTEIQGHGCGFDQADYPYACNFMDNSKGFHYPDSVGGLCDMLSDICRRLLYALYYTYSRCRTPSYVHGWRSCQYGKGIDSFNWDCDKHPNGKSNCQARSSLQSHLMDNLAGFLPHKVASNGTSLSCTSCKSSQPGQQCLTPMGFSDLSSAGSRNGTGEDICNVLKGFCGNADSPLCSLLRCLSTLCPVAPKGLAEMFSLFCNIMQRSHNSKYTSNDGYRSALDGAIDKCFPFKNCKSLHDNYDAADLTNALKDLYCNTDYHPNKATQEMNHCDLWSVSRPALTDSHAVCKNINGACAPYLQPLGLHAHHTYAEKHAGIYLSWFIHLTWQFWELLHGLLDAFTKMSCKTYECSCKCPPGKHGVCDEDASESQKPSKPSCYCPSVVNCHGVMSAFYKYGFTFRVPKELYNVGMTKTCEKFVKQMKKVLYKGHFEELFKQIDNFVWAIRLPFFWLNVVLWLLSLLYLIHIMVIRLDLLHIKSHLHSPSSHRIAAQSLLAAGRVSKLNRVFYLQP